MLNRRGNNHVLASRYLIPLLSSNDSLANTADLPDFFCTSR